MATENSVEKDSQNSLRASLPSLQAIPGSDVLLDGASAPSTIMPGASTTEEVVAQSPVVGRCRRNRIKYAKRKFVARYDFFLRTEFIQEYTDTLLRQYPSLYLVGKVETCPRKSTPDFTISWSGIHLDRVPQEWLVLSLPGTEDTKAKLQVGFQQFDALQPTQLGAQPLPNVPLPASVFQQHESPAPVPTPPSVVRAQQLANLTTCASTVSTLTRETRESQEPRVLFTAARSTRASDGTDNDSLSDEDDDLQPEEEDDDPLLSQDQQDHEEDREDEGDSHINQLLTDLVWKFRCVEGAPGPNQLSDLQTMYSGPEGLKAQVASKFTSPLNCFFTVSGFNFETAARLAKGSNDYFHRFVKPHLNRNNVYHGIPWCDISTTEMIRFLGILLKIGLCPRDGGGYRAYFAKTLEVVYPGENLSSIEITGSEGFAWRFMDLRRFQQIRGAFHPEDKTAGFGGDKCYQLRRLLNSFNAASQQTFHVPKDLAFDEGGVGVRSRYCPVRQYNKDKPQKFRVDFFICADSIRYVILHVDVYQGKNGNNVGIHPIAVDLPTTQKAVVNACYALSLHTETRGMRHISLDNRYQCPELAILLRERCNAYSSGTCRTNRKGWPKDLLRMGLKKKKNSSTSSGCPPSAPVTPWSRGTSFLCYDSQNRVTVGQWLDSKVVNFCSSLNDSGLDQVKRQVGSDKMTFDCPRVLIRYQQTMGAIDKGDQMRSHGGGFAARGHFKKWYKRVYLAIMDCGLLNSYLAWNLAAKDPQTRRRFRRFERHVFFSCVAEEMMTFEEEQETTHQPNTTRQPNIAEGQNLLHRPIPAQKKSRCIVCRLETFWSKELGEKGLCQNVCKCKECGVLAHTTLFTNSQRKIHQVAAFRGLTCFEIVHTQVGKEIWRENGRRQHSHQILQTIRESYGVSRKRKSSGSITDHTTNT